jgi:hypothetical protein
LKVTCVDTGEHQHRRQGKTCLTPT